MNQINSVNMNCLIWWPAHNIQAFWEQTAYYVN